MNIKISLYISCFLSIIAFYIYVIFLACNPILTPFNRFFFHENKVRFWNGGHGIDYKLGEKINTANPSTEIKLKETIPYFSNIGWEKTELWGTCTNRSDKFPAEMFFEIKEKEKIPHLLVFSGRPFLIGPPELSDTQKLEVYLNGVLLGSEVYSTTQETIFQIPSEALKNFDGILRFRFKYLGFKTDSKTKPLGFCISSIQIF